MAGSMAIITACAHETALVRRRLRVQQQTTGAAGVLWQGTLCSQEVVLLQCGMGPERAAQAVLWLGQHYQLAGVLSVGFAGGLQVELARGDAVLVTKILAPCDTPATVGGAADVGLRPDARLAHIAAMAVAQTTVVGHTGTLLSRPSVVAQAVAKRDMGQRSGALAVDMESYSVAQAAAQMHLPCAVLRTIFDTADEDMALPIATCLTLAGSLQPWRLLGGLASHPGLWLQLPHWWRTSHLAGHHLQRWLQHFFLLLSQGA
jgi:adenosylhomocysteine nucleosidase